MPIFFNWIKPIIKLLYFTKTSDGHREDWKHHRCVLDKRPGTNSYKTFFSNCGLYTSANTYKKSTPCVFGPQSRSLNNFPIVWRYYKFSTIVNFNSRVDSRQFSIKNVVSTSVTRKKSPNVYKSCPKWFH